MKYQIGDLLKLFNHYNTSYEYCLIIDIVKPSHLVYYRLLYMKSRKVYDWLKSDLDECTEKVCQRVS